MAITHGYATLADIKAENDSLAAHGTAMDTSFERAIETASRAVDKYCRRRFWTNGTAEVRTYTATNCEWIDVDDLATNTFTVETSSAFDRVFDVTWAASDYQTEPLNNEVNGIAWPTTKLVAVGDYAFSPNRIATVKVTGCFGFGTAVPTEVVDATVQLSLRRIARKSSPTGVQSSSEFGPIYISRKTDPDVAAVLDDFRRMGGISVA